MAEKLAKANQSIEKALQIIEIMADSREPMRLQDIAQQSGIPASTCLRMLTTLKNGGYVLQDRVSLRYSLSLKFAQIGSQVKRRINLQGIAHPYLTELAIKCRESSCIAIQQEMEVVYIDVEDGPDNMLQILQRIGKRAPMHCTGVGKVMLTDYDDAAIDSYIARKGLPQVTEHTLTTREALVEELARIRQQGYAIDNEECELGARCIATGIRDYTGNIVAGLSVSGPISRMSFERIEEIRPILLGIAADLSGQLSYHKAL